MPTKSAAKASKAETAASAGASGASAGLNPRESFQDLSLPLQQFWGAQGCVVLQP